MTERQKKVHSAYAAVINGLIALVAIAALIISIVNSPSQAQINEIQNARQSSATRTCYTLRILISTAYGAKYYAQGQDLIRRVGLADCVLYGKQVRKGQ